MKSLFNCCGSMTSPMTQNLKLKRSLLQVASFTKSLNINHFMMLTIGGQCLEDVQFSVKKLTGVGKSEVEKEREDSDSAKLSLPGIHGTVHLS